MQYIGEICRYLINQSPGEYDQKHSVTKAFGNGLRPEVWVEFQKRFHVPTICEFYAATEGTVVLTNNQNKVGAVGWLPPLIRAVAPYQ